MSEAEPTTAVSIEGLCFSFGRAQVLRDVALTVETGRFCCLLGPNGSGKTTLIHILSGVLRPAAGRVSILGRNQKDWSRNDLARRVAVVPQNFDLAFPYTVEEVVLLGRVPHRGPLAFDRSEDRRIAAEAMEATGVTHLAARRMTELSGGEFKRVVVAKALAQQPRLLLLDEAAAHLDIRHQVGLYDLIQDVRAKTGVTVLAAVHDLNLAAAYGDQFALLKEGQVSASGGLEDVMTYGRLRDVFGIDIYVGVNEVTGHRMFTPMVSRRQEEKP